MNTPSWKTRFSIGRLAEMACLLEVTASKPGNVHRGADFEDCSFIDFASSAVAMGQAIDDTAEDGYGATVLAIATQTKQVANVNTNLGMNLLIGFLACVARRFGTLDQNGTASFKRQLSADDAFHVFEAIRLMNPGGLGNAEQHDVRDPAPTCLIAAMSAAKDRDRVAAQFVCEFEDVFQKAFPWIMEGRKIFQDLVSGIVWAHVRMMAEFPDSLITRKCGLATAQKSQALAGKAIDSLSNGPESFFASVANLDFWLRSDGHRRNPGTTADLIAAGLFVGLYNEEIEPPF